MNQRRALILNQAAHLKQSSEKSRDDHLLNSLYGGCLGDYVVILATERLWLKTVNQRKNATAMTG